MTDIRLPRDDQWVTLDPESTEADFDEIMSRGITARQDPIHEFRALLSPELTDERLLALAGVARQAERITRDYADRDARWVAPLYPDFARTMIGDNEDFVVPVGDRSMLQRFFAQVDVEEAVLTHTGDEDTQVVEMPFSTCPSNIGALPVKFMSFEAGELFMLAKAAYWSETGFERYMTPADALRDISMQIPSLMLIPMTLTLEESFPTEVGEVSDIKPIIESEDSREYAASDGIIWQRFSADTIRSLVGSACTIEDSGYSRGQGFNGGLFNEEYGTWLVLSGDETAHDTDDETWRRFCAPRPWMPHTH